MRLRSTKRVGFDPVYKNRENYLEIEIGNFTELKSGGFEIEVIYYKVTDEELDATSEFKRKKHFISEEVANYLSQNIVVPEGLTESQSRQFKKEALFLPYVQNDWIDEEQTMLIFGLLPSEIIVKP